MGILGLFLIRYLIEILILIIIVFLTVCFLTLIERKCLGYVQNRKGPTKIIFRGLLQPVLDGGKLILKRLILEKVYYFFIPFLSILIMGILRLSLFFFRSIIIINNAIF